MPDPNTAPPPLTAAALDEIERLSKAATMLPWTQWVDHPLVYSGSFRENRKESIRGSFYRVADCEIDDEGDAEEVAQECANAAYIAAACNAAPSLAAEVRAARELVRLMEEREDRLEDENAALRSRFDALVAAAQHTIENVEAVFPAKLEHLRAAIAAARQEPTP